jgi:hypothetical protein
VVAGRRCSNRSSDASIQEATRAALPVVVVFRWLAQRLVRVPGVGGHSPVDDAPDPVTRVVEIIKPSQSAA